MKKPKIRFKGFTETWEQRKLSDVVDSVDTGKSRFDKYGGRLREALDWLFLQPGRGLCLMYAPRGDISAILVHDRIFRRHILLREEECRSLWLFLPRYQVGLYRL